MICALDGYSLRKLYGARERQDVDYIDLVVRGISPHHRKVANDDELQQRAKNLFDARKHVAPFIERCLLEIDWASYRIVGFTSVYQQQAAALALAKRLKLEFPDLLVVFGGANCEGIMGSTVLRSFSFVDAVCSGEGDISFPKFVEGLAQGGSLSEVPGIISQRARDQLGNCNSRPVDDINALPYPDFDDYFASFIKSHLTTECAPQLIFESSRGCWWGQKMQCTFCGLNGSSILFRQKTPRRTLEELRWLVERYGAYTQKAIASDNIMPFDFLRKFLSRLKELNLKLELFYESKSNLRKQDIQLFRDVGLCTFQPGIESLSTPVLRLMRKGVTGLENIQLLKWCRQFGVGPSWNYLVGFPGEQPEHYRGQEQVILSVEHLCPPRYCGPIRFDRFSPYFTDPARLGISNLRPYPSYRFIYPTLNERDLFDIAYFFVGEFEGQTEVDSYTRAVRNAVIEWRITPLNAIFSRLMQGAQ
jgi:ribosomal peptide maturation radical SAM protein 1